ncbi:hypothetical protein Q7O44_00450 [Shigella flexneri]|nr:hypothetical protein [Shigella flexneri]
MKVHLSGCSSATIGIVRNRADEKRAGKSACALTLINLLVTAAVILWQAQ